MTSHANSQRGTLLAVGVIIAGGAVAGWLLGRGVDAPAGARSVAAQSAATARSVTVPQTGGAASAAVTAAPVPGTSASPMSESELARLGEAAMVGARDSRLAAIERLSRAPRDQALPLLKRVLLNGEPGVDRPAALRGLRELALTQGDRDARIRDAVREVIYHGDDEALATDAQETLDVIARSAD